MPVPTAEPDAEPDAASHPASIRRDLGLHWLPELAVIGVFYLIYGRIRNQFGSMDSGTRDVARSNAQRVIDWEEALGLLIEDDIQAAFIEATAFIQFWNLFYGLFHFLVTTVVLVYLFWWRPDRYPFWRSSLLVATAVALAGYALFPLMPPRLLNRCNDFGACEPDWTFVDTAVEVGGIWSFETEAMAAVSNQYAAMPSLHVGWALWSAAALLATIGNRWGRAAAWVYPLLMIFAVVVTANHWWLDAVGGAVVVGIGVAVATLVRGAVSPGQLRRIVGTDVA